MTEAGWQVGRRLVACAMEIISMFEETMLRFDVVDVRGLDVGMTVFKGGLANER